MDDDLLVIYKINPEDFNLKPEAFDHQSQLHGIGHVYRVMYHCLTLGMMLELYDEARLAFFAAFLHDLSRKHDGKCSEHGRWAAKYKLPLHKELFIRYGANSNDLRHIRQAIIFHSLPQELPVAHSSWRIISILKDADALDRIRLGEADLNPEYLRFGESRKRIGFAKELYFATIDKPITRFAQVILEGNKVDSVLRG